MNKLFTIVILFSIVTLSVSFADGCKKNKAGNNHNPTPLEQQIPGGFPKPHYTFEDNPLTEEGFELGRRLFYDGRLSKDGNFPCASCHQQFAAFSTYDHNFSHGFNDAFTTRNAPGLWNLAWQQEFHLAGGIYHIEMQPLAPITAVNEMAETIENVLRKLKADSLYRVMFRKAFGTDEINSQRMLKALAQFTGSLVSADSKYDRYKEGLATFTPYEQRGYELFKVKCASCHAEPLFTDLSYRNIGLPAYPGINDWGRMTVTGDPGDSLKFKVPSLRNVSVTAPYMHDGRIATLQGCLEHYNSKIVQSPTLDPLLKNGIPLDRYQLIDLVAFLRTLTDTAFIKNPRFADPEQKSIFSPDEH